MEKIYERAKKVAGRIEKKWKEIPEPIDCVACGVDGSRGIKELSGVILYFVTSVSIGNEQREMSEVAVLRPHLNIEERVRLHMHTSEFRIGSLAEEELVLIDGSLRGAFVRPASYVDDPEKLMESYELENFVLDFLEILEKYFEVLSDDVRNERAKKNYLLTREEIFLEMEKSYRKGEKRLEDLMILAEYIEYLHALNRLLDKKVIFLAKNFYTNEFDDEVSDAAILEILSLEQFGFEKAGYISFKPQFRKTFPWFVREFRDEFKNLFRDINSAFVRFEDYGNIYLIESTEKIDEELISKLMSLEVNGYPFPLMQAHRIAKIKKIELQKLLISIISSLKPEFAPLLRSGRDVLDV